ncbi:MAG: division/cell wall cluster transcriptional repressor MraZ [Patescibacteria group bacterium]
MFIGTYYHTLEEQGRVSLPKTFRSISENWIVTRGLDGGLFIFTADSFQEKLTKIAENHVFTKKAHRDFVRLMTNEAQAIEVDNNGRVNLPDYLIKFAHLNKDLVIVGSLDYLEVWDRDLYHQYVDQLETNAEEIAEKVS